MSLLLIGVALASAEPCQFEVAAADVQHLFYKETPVGQPLCVSVVSPIDTESEPLRAVVMLHGLGDTPDAWSREGVVELWVSAMNAGRLPPMRLVLPQGNRGYWSNQIDGTARYRDWIFQVLDGLQEENTIRPSGHVIMGVSMGGHGALSIGLEYPEYFSTILALSPTDLSIAIEAQPAHPIYTHVFGGPTHAPYVAALEPREWLLRGAGKSQDIAIVVGSKEPDKFLLGVQRLMALKEWYDLNIDLLQVPDGCHCWTSTWGTESQSWLIEQAVESLESRPRESR